MDTSEIKKILMDHLLLKKVYVNKDDGDHYQIIVVSNQFCNMSTLKRQKIVYESLTKYILDGRIHSVSIQAFTLIEWENECECNVK